MAGDGENASSVYDFNGATNLVLKKATLNIRDQRSLRDLLAGQGQGQLAGMGGGAGDIQLKNLAKQSEVTLI